MSPSPRGRGPKSLPKLSPNELAIMSVLWDLRQATSRQILDRLPGPPALTTLLTYLTRLEAKGYVRHDAAERNRTYRPAVTRPSIASRLLDQALRQFEGRLSSLVSHFARTRDLSDDERRRLREILDQYEAEEKDR
jgi:predicted transcriptional regulator